jgi:hypothetical protein
MSRYAKVDLAYNFLVAKEKSADVFTIDELSQASGWKYNTCKTYPSKRWNKYVERFGDEYSVSGISYLSKEEFRNIHCQKFLSDIEESTKSIFVKKARQFALLAVSIYNNPYSEFKTYGFIVNLIIAYTALFHALFEKRGVSYLSLNNNGDPIIIDGEEKTWELKECIEHYWAGIDTPEKANIRFLIGLRNKIEHRSLPALDLAVCGECQAALNNFETILVDEFGSDYALIANLAISMQLTRISEQAQIEAKKELQSKNYEIVKNYMETYKNDLSDEILESSKYRLRAFLIPKIGNRETSSDLAIEFIKIDNLTDEQLLDYKRYVAFIKGIKPPYKLKPGKVVELVSKKIPSFNMHLHTKCWKYYNARPANLEVNFKGEYAGFIEGLDGYLYSQKWVDFLISELIDDDKFQSIKISG